MKFFNNFIVGNSADVIRQMSYLYFPKGAKIADLTYGQGVFAKGVDRELYEYHSSDLHKGGENGDCFYDFCDLPYADNSFDVVFFDPPWGCHVFYSHAQDFERAYENRYGGNGEWGGTNHDLKPAQVWQMYEGGLREAARIVKDDGIIVCKCQDGMVGNKQVRYEIRVWHYAVNDLGLRDTAKYVLYYPGHRPIVAKKQKNPRNCVSAFWVFRKSPVKQKRKAK